MEQIHADVDIMPGDRVWNGKDGFYREWDELTEDQKAAFVRATKAVNNAFRLCRGK